MVKTTTILPNFLALWIEIREFFFFFFFNMNAFKIISDTSRSGTSSCGGGFERGSGDPYESTGLSLGGVILLPYTDILHSCSTYGNYWLISLQG